MLGAKQILEEKIKECVGMRRDAMLDPPGSLAFSLPSAFHECCRTAPCPLEVTIKRDFAPVLAWREKAGT